MKYLDALVVNTESSCRPDDGDQTNYQVVVLTTQNRYDWSKMQTSVKGK